MGPGAHLCTKTPRAVMLVWGSSRARPHRTCVYLPQGIQPQDTVRPVPRNFKTAEFMPDWWGSGPHSWVWPLSWTPAWVRPPENWRNRRCHVRVQGPESSAKGHSPVEKRVQPIQGLVLTGSHPGHLALKMTLSALAFWSPPETSTTEHRFCFGPVSSFFLELVVIALCSSCSCPVSYWTPFDLGAVWGGALIGYHIFLPLHTVHGVLMAKIMEGVSISSSVDHFCQNPSLYPISLG